MTTASLFLRLNLANTLLARQRIDRTTYERICIRILWDAAKL